MRSAAYNARSSRHGRFDAAMAARTLETGAELLCADGALGREWADDYQKLAGIFGAHARGCVDSGTITEDQRANAMQVLGHFAPRNGRKGVTNAT